MKIILDNDNFINLHILVDILNNDKSFNLRYENKQKTVTNFLKSNYKGIINFLKNLMNLLFLKKIEISLYQLIIKKNSFKNLMDGYL